MSTKLKIVVGVVVVVVLVVIAVSLLTGDDDSGSSSAPSAAHGDGDGGDGDSAPSLRTVTTKRSTGRNATAATSAIIDRPREIWLRVSAAPKQDVTGQWNVSCGSGAIDSDTYDVKPPHLMKLRIPAKSAKSCIAGTSAQLKGTGRLKVSILRDR